MTSFGQISPLRAGLTCRCPKCGRGKLYRGLLTVADTCDVCGLNLSAQDSGDGPAVFVIFIVGGIAVLVAFIVEKVFAPPLGVHLIYQIPLVIGLSIGLLRPFKATLIALQYRHKTPGFDSES